MVLYSVVSTYQLLSAMIHRENHYPREEAVLMIASTLCEKFPEYQSLKNFFADIAVFPLMPVPEDLLTRHANDEFFRRFFKEWNRDIRSFEKIYVGAAHYHFGVYLCSQKIPFCMFEDAAGVFSAPDVLMNTDRRLAPTRSRMARDYRLYTGENPVIVTRVGNRFAQVEGYQATNFEHQDVIESFESLPPERQTAVRRFFVKQDLFHVPEHSTVVLTQHFANLKMLTFEGQVTIYQYLADYFLPGRTLVIKPHPDDLLYYSSLFPDATVINVKFPSELLPVLFDNRPAEIATVSSTAVGSLKRYFTRCLDMTPAFERDFRMTPRYDAALRFLASLGASVPCGLGVNQEIVNGLWSVIIGAEAERPVYTLSDRTRWMVVNETEDDGYAALSALPEDGCAVFINQSGENGFLKTASAAGCTLTPMRLTKTFLRQNDVYTDPSPDILWVAAKTAGPLRAAEQFSWQRTLPYSGLKTEVSPMSEQEREILALRGNVKALETRLEAMIQRNKRLEKQLTEQQQHKEGHQK